jgi:hypothetical protein
MIPALTNAVAAMAPAAIKTTKAVHSAQRRLCAAIVNLFAAMFYAKPETHCGRPCGVHGFGPRLTSSSAPGRFVCGEAWDAVDLACCMFEGLVDRDARSPATLDEYRPLVNRVVTPGVGSLRLGEVSAPRLDRFVQPVLRTRDTPQRNRAELCCRASFGGWCDVVRFRSTRSVISRRWSWTGTVLLVRCPWRRCAPGSLS